MPNQIQKIIGKKTDHFQSVEKVIRNLKKYEEEHFMDTTPVIVNKKSKVFYHYTEWSGWRFWLKAIRHLDFASMKSHTQMKKSLTDLITKKKQLISELENN